MVTAKYPISPMIFSNSRELERALGVCKRTHEEFLARLSEPLEPESNGNVVSICLPGNCDCPEVHERDCPSPYFEEEFDANEDQDLGDYRV